MKKLLSVALALVLLFGCCVSANAEADDWYTEKDGVISILLEGNPTTGYEWTAESSAPELTGPIVLDFCPANTEEPGAGGVYTGTVANVEGKTGSCYVTFTYARSWEDEPLKTCTLDLEADENGLYVIGSGMSGEFDQEGEEDETFIPFFMQDEETGIITLGLPLYGDGTREWIVTQNAPELLQLTTVVLDDRIEIVCEPAEGARGTADVVCALADFANMDLREMKLVRLQIEDGVIVAPFSMETQSIAAYDPFEDEDAEVDAGYYTGDITNMYDGSDVSVDGLDLGGLLTGILGSDASSEEAKNELGGLISGILGGIEGDASSAEAGDELGGLISGILGGIEGDASSEEAGDELGNAIAGLLGGLFGDMF